MESGLHITTADGIQLPIEWSELNLLKKDILWCYDENGTELHNAFLPCESFHLLYWKYLGLAGTEVYEEDRLFYTNGALVIIICMVAEYIDVNGGNQGVFRDNKISDIKKLVDKFVPVTQIQEKLKSVSLLGLSIAESMTEEDKNSIDQFSHKDLSAFYHQTRWISLSIIKEYYQSQLKGFNF